MVTSSSSNDELLQGPLSVARDVFERHLSPLMAHREDVHRQPSVELIVECASRYFGVPTSGITGQRRGTQENSDARQAAMYLARELTEFSSTQLARAFNRRDHTTILYSHTKIRNTIAVDQMMAKQMRELRELVLAIQVELVDNNVSGYVARKALAEWQHQAVSAA